ncbi:MAG: 6-phosphofructokinase [Flavobacteriales bacterium]|nr:6-phosphofructokinase [Flavobacteriales bacterium]
MQNIAVFTSGGDAPGMNACIRAVVRTAIYAGVNVFGIKRGYEGLIDGDIELMDSKSVGNIIQRGGTILKSARSKRFFEKKYRKKAFGNLMERGIEGVISIGGDGTFQGAHVFSQETNIPFIGLPGTIDNDLLGTDYTIGYDTALNTVVEAVDRIRDTADSHDRLFVIEVMGKDAGFIALRSGIGCGAEAVLVPETPTYVDHIIKKLEQGRRQNKSSGIVIVAEGDDSGGAYEIAKKITDKFQQYDTRVTVLGHVQRGGSPTAMDRVLASRLGNAAVTALLAGKRDVMLGIVNKNIEETPFDKATKHHDKLNTQLIDLVEVLSI